jgi:hypothetical protein
MRETAIRICQILALLVMFGLGAWLLERVYSGLMRHHHPRRTPHPVAQISGGLQRYRGLPSGKATLNRVAATEVRVRGLEHEPERGIRRTMCFDMRFERTALYAHEHGFPVVTGSPQLARGWRLSWQGFIARPCAEA